MTVPHVVEQRTHDDDSVERDRSEAQASITVVGSWAPQVKTVIVMSVVAMITAVAGQIWTSATFQAEARASLEGIHREVTRLSVVQETMRGNIATTAEVQQRDTERREMDRVLAAQITEITHAQQDMQRQISSMDRRLRTRELRSPVPQSQIQTDEP